MKKTIIITVLLLAAGIIYVSTRQVEDKATVYQSNSQAQVAEPEKPGPETIAETVPANNAPQPNSGNLSPETGWSAFPKVGEQPAPDVTAQINVGTGSPEPKTISAKQGQRVSITFTASIRDQVVIEGYNYDTYIEPMRDSTLGFTVDKKGSFKIQLANKKTVVGFLNID